MRSRLALPWLLAGLLGGALLLWPWGAAQRSWLDLQLRWAAPAQVDGVLHVDIDDASLRALRDELGPWPLPRDAYALLIEALREAGARAIVLDLVLSDARAGDAALVRAIGRGGAPVLLAAASPDGRSLSLPHEGLLAARPLVGLVTAPLDPDGVLRHWSPRTDGVAPMPLAVLQSLNERPRLSPDAGGRLTPRLAREEPARLAFAPLVQAARNGALDAASQRLIQGRVVFIGASGVYADRVMSPLGQRDGASLLASSYAALRDGLVLRPLPAAAQAALLLLVLLPAGLAWRAAPPRPSLLLGTHAALLALLGALVLLLPLRGWWIDPTAALAALALSLGLQLFHQQREARRQAERLRQEQQIAAAARLAQSQFLATISHELRTPLSAVLGLAELLGQGQLSDTQRRQVRLIGSAGRSLLTLIDELLDLSRIDRGRLDLHAEPTALTPLLEDTLALLAPRAAERQVRCELQLEPGLPEAVRVDAQRLRQVLLNLLGNAIKFAPQGHVSLQVTRRADGRLLFAVSDTGIGIDSSQLQRIFEPFLQAQGQDARLGGSGLGLAISRQLVRLMGGDIEVHSVPGAGSRFAFALDLPACPVPAPAHPPSPPARRGLQLLLAEDDELLAELLQAQLAPLVSAGGQIERAGNGHLALALLKRLRFDLLLIDLNLPGLDGHAVVRALREHERQQGLPRLPVVALSAHAHADDAQASLAAGCDAHLNKPIDQGQLLDALRRWAPPSPG